MAKPVLVGITTYEEPEVSWRGWHRSASLVPHDFIEPLARAGAAVVLLPPGLDDARTLRAAEGIDALVLVGGADIDPRMYGGGAEGSIRDRAERALLLDALERKRPVLGVCRGMQLLNVCLGGTLVEHIAPEDRAALHQPPGPRFVDRPLCLEPADPLTPLFGADPVLPCFHHQAVDSLGEGLRIVGRSPDGIVEVLALDGPSFVLGIQGHPEAPGPRVPHAVFDALIRAAAEATL